MNKHMKQVNKNKEMPKINIATAADKLVLHWYSSTH